MARMSNNNASAAVTMIVASTFLFSSMDAATKYLGGFFVDERLIVTGLGGLTWMSIGAFIMAKMVSFEI